jgi:hypothetical protein
VEWGYLGKIPYTQIRDFFPTYQGIEWHDQAIRTLLAEIEIFSDGLLPPGLTTFMFWMRSPRRE